MSSSKNIDKLFFGAIIRIKRLKKDINMLKINKIAIKAILPELVLTFALSAVTLGTGVYTANKTIKTTGQITTHDKWLVTLMTFMLCCMCLDTFGQYVKIEKFSTLVARKYLKKCIKSMPDMKNFEAVLDNPKAMKSLTALIFNSLRPSERKMVNDIALKTMADFRKHENPYLEDEEIRVIGEKLFAKAYVRIMKIIRDHATVHPEFISDIYKAMAYADMTYVVQNPIQQRTR